MTMTTFLNSTKSVNWTIKDKQICHSEYGKIQMDSVIKNSEYDLLSIIPLLKDNALVVFIAKEDGHNCLYLIDIRYDVKNKRLSSSADFKFYIGRKKLKRLKDEIKSCCRKEGTLGIGFFLRRLSALKINNIVTDEYLK